MTPGSVALLACPHCRAALELSGDAGPHDLVETGSLTCVACRALYPIINGVPRFVPPANYSSNFGLQWNRFRRTQLDSCTGQPISHDRFYRQSGWRAGELEGRTVLDVGCGAGRFTEVALAAGARVVAMDYSTAVDACRANFASVNRLTVVQGDVYHLPLQPGVFDFVYCFGVLQHTPDVKGAFLALREPLRPGGRVAVDLYPRLRKNVVWPKYWLRPLTKRLPPARLLRLVERMVGGLLPLSLALGRVPAIGRQLRHIVPVANYDGILPLSPDQNRQWALLDTFDMLAPQYDQPQTPETLRNWFDEAGYAAVEVYRQGLVVGRGRRPAAPMQDCGRVRAGAPPAS